MPVTNYHTIGGNLLGEKTTGSTRVDYLTDALGSITATVNQSAAIVNTYRYKPYGTQLAKTGVGSDPAFTWVGSAGYRQTGRKFSDVYVRARHYDTTTGRWTTKDPFIIYPWRASYFYADVSPVLLVDASGLFCGKDDCCSELKNPDGSAKPNEHCKKSDGTPGKWLPFTFGNIKMLDSECTKKGTCNSLLKELKSATNYCKDMCDQSRNLPKPDKPGGYTPDAPWAAMELCCENRMGTSDFIRRRNCGVFYCDRGNGLGGSDACWMKCSYQHEKRHTLQCTRKVRPPKDIPNPGAWDECDAYRISVKCLLEEASKKCGKNIPSDIRQKVTKCLHHPALTTR